MDSRSWSGWRRLCRLGALMMWACTLQGCASIVSGSQQVLSVDTPGCPGARCELSNDKGRFFVASTPGTVTLSRSYNNLQVVCSKDGTTGEPVSVASTTKGMAFGNILFGGVIGAGVDIHTGAAYDYPQLISVPLQCGPPGQSVAAISPGPGAPPARLGLQVERLLSPNGMTALPGARVLLVAPGSPAEAAGLLPGDLILAAGDRPIRDPADLAAALAALAAKPEGSPVLTLHLRRGNEDLVRQLPLPAPAR